MDYKSTYQKMITSMQGGWGAMAGALGMTVSALENYVYEKKGQSMSVHLAEQMQDISQTTYFAQATAKNAGGTFVKLPDMDHIDNESILATMTKLQIELGQWNAHLAAAIANDGEIDKGEKAKLESIMDEIHRTLNELLALNLRLYSRHDKAPKAAA